MLRSKRIGKGDIVYHVLNRANGRLGLKKCLALQVYMGDSMNRWGGQGKEDLYDDER